MRSWPNPPSNELAQSITVYPNDQLMLLAAQSASVHERRRTLRERQRSQVSLALLVIPPHPEKEVEDTPCFSPDSSEEPRSRFSLSVPPSPAAMCSPVLPVPSPKRKRKSILAKLVKCISVTSGKAV